MKTIRLLLALALGATLPLQAQEPAADEMASPLTVMLSPEQLDQLLAPIALYPDALIALILPASTFPADIVLAARHLKDNPNDFSQVEHRAWDDSVKSLTHYPDVLKWMDENLTWTKRVGEAFVAQPADVMNSIQRLRGKAHASGALASTPQQQVLSEPDVIRIVPADPEIIYVPRYDPAVVFVDRPYYYSTFPSLLTFGVGCRVGSWLAYDFDWRRRTLWVGDRHRRWHGHHDWRHPVVPITPVPPAHTHTHRPIARPWQPPARFHRPAFTTGPNPHPRPLPSRPGVTSTLAQTYGRTSVPAQPSNRHSPRPVVTPPQSTHPTAHWQVRPDIRSDIANRPTVVPRPRSPASNSTSPRHTGNWQRNAGRTQPNATPASIASTPPLPTAPPLNTIGPMSAVRPTVVAAPMNRTVPPQSSHASPLSHASRVSRVGVAPRGQTHSRPGFASPAATVVAPRAQPPRPSPQVQAPAPQPAPAPPPSATVPGNRGGNHDSRRGSHGRSDLN